MLDRVFNKINSSNNKPPLNPVTDKLKLTLDIPSAKKQSDPENEKKSNPVLSLTPVVCIGGNVLMLNNTVQLSSHCKVDTKKSYLAKLVANNRQKNAIYYPVTFVDGIAEDNIGLAKHIREQLNYNFSANNPMTSPISPVELIEIRKDLKPLRATTIGVEIQAIETLDKLKYIEHIDTDELNRAIATHLKEYPVILGQDILMRYDRRENAFITFLITEINDFDSDEKAQFTYPAIYNLDEKSQIYFSVAKKAEKQIALPDHDAAKIPLDFVEDGIGGHKKELKRLLREGFFTRALGAEYAEAYGVSHTKGILLYGPPGTGKTLIARVIGGKFKQSKVKVVNGPEFKNKFVGVPQEKLRAVFADAITDWKKDKEQSPLHVIIFDELDAIAPRRGTHTGGVGVEDDMVTTLLTMMDGVDSPGNILVIGTTNRKELIDEALLRPGRIEVHLEIGIPDQKGRLEILNIKIKKQKASGVIDENVDLAYWAKATENFTGAEIEQLVKKATQFAAGENLDADENALAIRKDVKNVRQLKKVKQEHFIKAFAEITPAFGINKDNFKFNPDKFVLYNRDFEEIILQFKSCLEVMQSNQDLNRLQFLISGNSGTGKTELAKCFAVISGAKYIKIISPDKLLALPSLLEKINYLDREFADARHSELSVIILDELEKLLQADIQLKGCVNELQIKFDQLLKAQSDVKNKCIVIATTKSEKFIKDMQLYNLFNETSSLKNVVFEYANDNDIKVLSEIVSLFHFNMVRDSFQAADDKRVIDLPLRELIYLIKKFGSIDQSKNSFNLDKFYNFINAKNVKLDIKTQKSTMTKSLLFGGPTSISVNQLIQVDEKQDVKPLVGGLVVSRG